MKRNTTKIAECQAHDAMRETAPKPMNMTGQILYICDRRKCEICRDECRHTNDITHAEHFKKIGGVIMEKER